MRGDAAHPARTARIRFGEQLDLPLSGAGAPRHPGHPARAGARAGDSLLGSPEADGAVSTNGVGAVPVDDVPLRSLEYVVVDVETTGGAVHRGHRITEIAAWCIDGSGRVLESFETLVNPERPIPPFITALTRITQDMVANAPRFHEIAEDVHRLLAGRVFVAHNAAFDWRFLCRELEWATGRAPEGKVLCTVRLSRQVVPEVRSRSLDALTEYFGVENEARHRAYGDARATVELLRRLFERLEEREIEGWAALEALLRRRAPRRRRRSSLPRSMDSA